MKNRKRFVSKKVYLFANGIVWLMPSWIFNICKRIRIIWKNIRMPEQRISCGELNEDKTFFVIRFYPPASGLMTFYLYTLGMMQYADTKGWIPVVDLQNYENMYSLRKPVHGTMNVWEHYFLQPETDGKRYSLDEVYSSKNVVLSNGTMDDCYHSKANNIILNWQIKQNKRLGLYPEVMDYLEKTYRSTIPVNARVLGTIVRGRTRKRRNPGHEIQIKAVELVPILRDRVKRWQCDYIFLKAEEQEDLEEIKKSLKNVLHTTAKRVKNYKDSIILDYSSDADFGISNDNELPATYTNQVEYLAEIYILSKCTSLVSTGNNGLYGARIWNGNNFEHFEVIDLGVDK